MKISRLYNKISKTFILEKFQSSSYYRQAIKSLIKDFCSLKILSFYDMQISGLLCFHERKITDTNEHPQFLFNYLFFEREKKTKKIIINVESVALIINL